MPGEIITAKSLEEGKLQLRDIYKKKSQHFEEITKDVYLAYDTDEREDSDNHLNEERLEKGESEVIDLAYYKFLPDRKTAYRIILKDKQGKEMEDYFVIVQEVV